jgi:putative PIN family toxin of toxin-antitoxin system
LDANVLIAALTAQGLCHLVLEKCLAENEMVGSDALLAEVSGQLRDKLKIPPDHLRETLSFLRAHMEVVTPRAAPSDRRRDPKDLHVLGAALAGNCDLIVTGDKDLLVLDSFEGMPILSPRGFWDRHRKA